MSQLGFKLAKLVKDFKQDSYSTRSTRKNILNLCAKQLLAAGFKLRDPSGLKPKHIEVLVNQWKAEGIADKTLKNRLSELRWWSRSIGKPNIVARDNSAYSIGKLKNNPVGKSKELDLQKLNNVTCPYVQHSLRLQQAFGLRREEAIKFNVAYADQGEHIRLKGSWTKGGKYREVPITTNAQRQLINDIRAFTKGGSLIPAQNNYKQQLGKYERETANAGLNKNHGLRHHYARERYLALTGWKCPADGGISRKSLSETELARDVEVRLIISRELGHERFSISYTYLGS